MSLRELFNAHSHYWGVPHTRPDNNLLVQTCYGCSREREVRIDPRPSEKVYPLSTGVSSGGAAPEQTVAV